MTPNHDSSIVKIIHCDWLEQFPLYSRHVCRADPVGFLSLSLFTRLHGVAFLSSFLCDRSSSSQWVCSLPPDGRALCERPRQDRHARYRLSIPLKDNPSTCLVTHALDGGRSALDCSLGAPTSKRRFGSTSPRPHPPSHSLLQLCRELCSMI